MNSPFPSCFPTGSPARALQQSPVSVTKPESKTVLITCHVSVPDFDKAFIHWYRTRPGAAPERVAYMASTLFLANREDEGKFSIEKDLGKSLCTLTVTKVTLQDAGTYYCARWDAQQKRVICSLHKDVLHFLDQTLKCPKPQEMCPPCLPISPSSTLFRQRGIKGAAGLVQAVQMLSVAGTSREVVSLQQQKGDFPKYGRREREKKEEKPYHTCSTEVSVACRRRGKAQTPVTAAQEQSAPIQLGKPLSPGTA